MRIFEEPSTEEETSKQPLRIFHFLYDHVANPWVGGGAAIRAQQIYRRLASRHNITVISGKYPEAEDHTEDGVRYRFLGTDSSSYILSTFSYAFNAARYLRAHSDEADIVIEDFAPYNPIFSYRVRRDAILQLHQKEGTHILRKYFILGLPFYWIEKRYPGLFRNVTVVSEESRKKYGLGETAQVIPNGFTEGYLDVEAEDGGYLLFLGRLEIDQKALDVLFEAMSSLEGVHLKIAGKGKDEQKVRDMVRRAGDRNRIELLGYVEGKQKEKALRNCSAVVIPSRFEGSPLTVLEAAAFGKPVLVSDIPELSYAVKSGFGLEAGAGDARGLAENIEKLMGSDAFRLMMGRKARHYARDFTWEAIAGRYEGFLMKAMEADG